MRKFQDPGSLRRMTVHVRINCFDIMKKQFPAAWDWIQSCELTIGYSAKETVPEDEVFIRNHRFSILAQWRQQSYCPNCRRERPLISVPIWNYAPHPSCRQCLYFNGGINRAGCILPIDWRWLLTKAANRIRYPGSSLFKRWCRQQYPPVQPRR
jgi:hypothetical protein